MSTLFTNDKEITLSPDANSIPILKDRADEAFDAATWWRGLNLLESAPPSFNRYNSGEISL